MYLGVYVLILTIWIFCVQLVFSTSGPWQQVVITAVWHPIITNTNNLIVLVHYTRTNLEHTHIHTQNRF